MPAQHDDMGALQRRLNGFYSMSAEGFRLFVQWGFVPLVVYLGTFILIRNFYLHRFTLLGSQKPAILPTGERVPFSLGQLFYG